VPTNINRVVLEGELVQDPIRLGEAACRLHLLVTTLRKATDGTWVGRPNLFEILVEGPQAEQCLASLRRGRPVAVEGQLQWEPASMDDPNARARVEVLADNVRPTDVRAALLIPPPEPEGEAPEPVVTVVAAGTPVEQSQAATG